MSKNWKPFARLVSARDSLEAELIASGGEGVLITEARRTVLTQQPLQLLQKLREGTFSAVAVLEAFQAKVKDRKVTQFSDVSKVCKFDFGRRLT